MSEIQKYYNNFKSQAAIAILSKNPYIPVKVALKRIETFWSLMAPEDWKNSLELLNENVDLLAVDLDLNILHDHIKKTISSSRGFNLRVNYIKTHEVAFNSFWNKYYDGLHIYGTKELLSKCSSDIIKNLAYCVWKYHQTSDFYITSLKSLEMTKILDSTGNPNKMQVLFEVRSRILKIIEKKSSSEFFNRSVFCLLSKSQREESDPKKLVLNKLTEIEKTPITFFRYKYTYLMNNGKIDDWVEHRNNTTFDEKMEKYMKLRSDSTDAFADFICFARSNPALDDINLDDLKKFFIIGTSVIEQFYESEFA